MGKGMMNSNEKYAENFVRSEAGKLLAEVFFRELQFISGDGTLSDRLVVRNCGMNSRVRSQDVLGIQTRQKNGSCCTLPVMAFTTNCPNSFSIPSPSARQA